MLQLPLWNSTHFEPSSDMQAKPTACQSLEWQSLDNSLFEMLDPTKTTSVCTLAVLEEMVIMKSWQTKNLLYEPTAVHTSISKTIAIQTIASTEYE